MPRPSVRDKLIAAAVEAFHARGFKACTIEDIADRAKVFKGSFYNHFKSKEALAVEVVQLYEKMLADSLPLDNAASPMQRLREHFDFLLTRYQKFGFRGCLLGNLSVEIAEAGPALRSALAGAFDRWCGRVAEVLRQAQAVGQIKNAHDPEQLARYLVNSWEGATTRLKIVKNRGPMDDFFALGLGSLIGDDK
jgi:TetR/AcrR family transcriptional regulator, transcriptional repressor for nem operon